MKERNEEDIEMLKINKSIKVYNAIPKDKKELREIVEERYRNHDAKNILDLNDIDVSDITDMSRALAGLPISKIDISLWDVSNVETMQDMFYWCEFIEPTDLSQWDVSKVRNMSGMFARCSFFNTDVSNWDVKCVENMNSMFKECQHFNIDISKWNVSNVKYFRNTFNGCHNFNIDLSSWNVHQDAKIVDMFHECFNLQKQPLWYLLRK